MSPAFPTVATSRNQFPTGGDYWINGPRPKSGVWSAWLGSGQLRPERDWKSKAHIRYASAQIWVQLEEGQEGDEEGPEALKV